MMNSQDMSIQDRRSDILARIAKAAQACGRAPEDITLTAVSKVQPDDRIEAMLATGQRVFGENRVQEAQQRWGARRYEYPDLQLRLIGPLQTNKVGDAVALFNVIETVDRPKLLDYLARAMDKTGLSPQLFVQINTGAEPQKAGVLPEMADMFIEGMRRDHELSPVGVMCIPPVNEPAGPHFALLAKIARRNGIAFISAGMSDDFETAIRFGATHVRVGSALFGPRVS